MGAIYRIKSISLSSSLHKCVGNMNHSLTWLFLVLTYKFRAAHPVPSCPIKLIIDYCYYSVGLLHHLRSAVYVLLITFLTGTAKKFIKVDFIYGDIYCII